MVLVVGMVLALGGIASGASISWNVAQPTNGPGDIRTDGTLVEAINARNSNTGSVPVNGVTFANSNALLPNNGAGGMLNGANTGDAGLDTLLNTLDLGGGTATSFTMGGGGLVVGNDYLVQTFFTDRRGCCSGRVMTFGDGEAVENTVNVHASAGGGYGQFATGTFTADAATQTLTLKTNGFGNAHITGYQVRDLAPPPPPPSVTNIGSADPSGVIEQLNGGTNVTSDRDGSGGNRITAQTFTAPQDFDLGSIILRANHTKDFGATNGASNLEIKVFDMDSGTDDPQTGLPDSDNTLLGTYSFDVDSLSYATGDWLSFDLGAPLSLNNGELYGFIVSWDGQDPDNVLTMTRTTSNQLPNGVGRFTGSYNASNWTGANPFSNISPQTGWDVAFVATAAPTGDIPEPVTMLAVFAGLAGLGGYVRRRKQKTNHRSTGDATMLKTSKTLTACVAAFVFLAVQGGATAGLQHYWAFDEGAGAGTALDTGAGTQRDGTVKANVTTGVAGMFDNAYEFDGTNDSWVQVTGYKGITGKNARTVSAWVDVGDLTTRGIVGWGGTAAGKRWEVVLQSNESARVNVDNGNIIGNDSLKDLGWSHVIVSLYDKNGNGTTNINEGLLYVNGVKDHGSVNSNAVNTASGVDVRLGRGREGDGARRFDGKIDDIALWNEGLTVGEMVGIYNVGNTLTYNAGDFDQLKQIHDAAAGSIAVGGKTWSYVTGLAGTDGQLTDVGGGDYELVLDASAGTGLQTAPVAPPAPPPPVTTYAGAVLADGPLAYYRLNETGSVPSTADDATTNNNDGTYQNQLVLGSAGPRPSDGFAGFADSNNAPEFNKEANDYVTMPAGFLPTGSAERTVEGWFYSTDNPHNHDKTFFNYGPDSTGDRMTITADGGRVTVAVSGHEYGKTGLALNPGWHHVAVVLPDGENKSNKFKLYVDGGQLTGLSKQAGSTRTITTTDSNRRIGRSNGTSTYAGQIDELAIYGTDLSPDQIRDHYLTALVGRDTVLLHDHFLAGGLGTGDTGSVNGGFKKVTNSAGGNGSASESGTNASVTANGGNNDNTGIVSINTFDPTASPAFGFTATWVVTSAQNPKANGINLSLQADDGFINTAAGRPNLLFRFDQSDDNRFHLLAHDGSTGIDLTPSDPITMSQVTDGFTLTATLNAAGWSYSATGLDSLADNSGTWTGSHNYSSLFDSDTHVGAFIQKGSGANKTLEIDRITITQAIPEPATMLAVFAAITGLGGYIRKRRRSGESRISRSHSGTKAMTVVGLATACVLWAAVPTHAGTILRADFDASPLRAAGAAISAADLNAGTTGGTWTVNDDQESLIGPETSDAANHALAGDRGPYDFDLAITAAPPTFATDQVVVSFDSQIVRTATAANAKKNFITGWDGSSSKVFEIVLTTAGGGSASTPQGRLKYVNQSGSEVVLANNLESVGATPATFDVNDMTNLRIEMAAATMDVFVGNVLQADDIAYRTAGVADLASLSLTGSGGADSNAAGAWYDNIEVSATAQAPPAPDPRSFYFLNTEGSSPGRGNIDAINYDGTGRTNLLDVEPSPFGNVTDWKGFATDGEYYYFLNTQGGATWRGNIDRINLDGTGRTTLLDIDPSPFGAINAWSGFATDGEYFYLLQTGQGNPNLGRIDRINLDGTGRITLVDLDPSPFGAIEAWHGFATDGQYFYLLQTGQGNPNLGRIDRINMDGTGRITLLDVDPTTFGAIENWRGFAVDPVATGDIPEPVTLVLAGLGLAGLGGYVRRRRRV